MPPDRTDPIEPVPPAASVGIEDSPADADAETGAEAGDAPRVAIIGCGALGRELVALTRDLPGVRVLGVDARLHMRPERIAAAVEARIEEARRRWGPDVRLFVA